MQDKPYNDIYEKLVEGDNDLMGIVAYAFYKKHKIEWVTNYKSKNGNSPSEDEFTSFYNTAKLDSSLNGYRQQAETTISAYLYEQEKKFEKKLDELSENVEKKLNKIETSYNEDLIKQLKEKQEPFMIGVFKSIVGSFFFVILIGIIYFFTWSIETSPTTEGIKSLKESLPKSKKENYSQQ